MIVDLMDFIPEEFTLRFSINKHKYEVSYGEASVDEVLKMLVDPKAPENEDFIDKARRSVVEFLVKHAAKDGEKLREDLKLVPYKSTREGLDIVTLKEHIEQRHKKKENGESKPKAE